MPAANKTEHSASQERPKLDLDRFTRIIGLLGSAHEGERANALALGSRMLEAAGMRWEDFIGAWRQAELATEAAALLLAENEQLRAENERLRSTTGTAVAAWQDVGARVTDARRAAAWALGLHARGEIWLSPDFEIPFLRRCTTWTGRLTPKMQPIFQRIMDRIVERTGKHPPA